MVDTTVWHLVLGAWGVALLAAAILGARIISRRTSWEPAGSIALIAAAPVVPRIPLVASLTADDLLPLLGVGLLVLRTPFPRPTADRWARGALLAVGLATIARIASGLANGDGPEGTLLILIQAVARPVVLLGIVAYVAASLPEDRRHRAIVLALATVGTYEAVFGLIAFTVGLPGGAGLQGARAYTTVEGMCPGLISGTLGLSANHMGAMFVLSLPLTVALAVREQGRARWLWLLAASGQIAALLLTFTRSSILLGIILVAAFLIYERKFAMLAALTTAATVLAISVTSFACTFDTPGSVFPERFSDGNDRLALWWSAGRMMLDHPISGVGLGLMLDVVRENPDRYGDTPFGPATSSAHNTILLAGAETGVPGALAVAALNIVLAVIALRCARRGRARGDPLLVAVGMVMVGYLVQGMVNNLFSIPATSSLLALLVGGFALPRAEREPEPAGRAGASPYTPTAVNDTGAGGDR